MEEVTVEEVAVLQAERPAPGVRAAKGSELGEG